MERPALPSLPNLSQQRHPNTKPEKGNGGGGGGGGSAKGGEGEQQKTPPGEQQDNSRNKGGPQSKPGKIRNVRVTWLCQTQSHSDTVCKE